MSPLWREKKCKARTTRLVALPHREELASQLVGWAGLRNVLVHVYLDIDHERIFEILQSDLDQLQRFAEAVARTVSDGPA